MKETLTRDARTRRLMALVAWTALVLTAFSLWNARATGNIRVVTAEPIAFILAAFCAFVGVFAWMLYNPVRRTSLETPGTFFAAGVTLFPPPIIGFCLMPYDSPLRWWLGVGMFLLCVIAILSHVPDEFFAVPRGRHTYLGPVPNFGDVEGSAMDPKAAWFTFSDISQIVPDTERPSLAPRAYLQERPSRPPTTAARPGVLPVSDVDDILGADFDVDLLDDLLIDDSPNKAPSSSTAPLRWQKPDSTSEQKSRNVPQKADKKPEPEQQVTEPVVRYDQWKPQTPAAEDKTARHQNKRQSPADRVDDFQIVQHGTRTSLDLPVGGAFQKPAHTPDTAQHQEPESYRRTKQRPASQDESPDVQTTLFQETAEIESTLPEATPVGEQLERTVDEDGAELVEGVMAIHFEEGQKKANLHVPFSPPFSGMPEVECECMGGENLRLKVPVRQSYGIRIEARRSNADQALDAEIGFAAFFSPE